MAQRWPDPAPENALQQICREIEEAELSGELRGLFKRGGQSVQEAQSPPDQMSRKSFLDSFKTGMNLYKSTFMKIYGYELTWPGFAEDALTRLEILGCSRAREYYTCAVAEYEYEHEKEMISVAKWYRKQSERERSEKPRARQQETEQRRIELLNKKKQLLLEKKRLLLTENLQE
ncbi:hypothetical protein [Sporofaciens sp. JLR.KK001]|jgi:hypothetical protein|uniref:hypothetical protein n=1 Tax=Sporofaciens sp. JLR.KK001 TaxID=3112621 RepID=UPI002FEE9B1F